MANMYIIRINTLYINSFKPKTNKTKFNSVVFIDVRSNCNFNRHFLKNSRVGEDKRGTWKSRKIDGTSSEEIGWHGAWNNSCYSRLGEHDQNVARIYELDNQQHPH